VLDVDATALDTVPMGDSGKLRLGQQVVALGYALGLEGGPSVTTGIVSSLNRIVTAQDANCPEPQCAQGQRTYNDIIQTDAAINPGNSGGPLVDLNGEVVGINTAGAGAASAENIGFAIQIDAAKPTILDAVADPNEPVAYLGVGSVDADNPQVQFEFDPAVDQGALLASIAPGGPAERAGIRVGDVVVGFDGEAVDGARRLGELIGDHAPGDRVEVEVVDPDGGRRTVEVILGTNPVAP
jgi:serine protease Do